MHITDLNKVINLFLVGSLALVLIVFLWFDEIQAFYRAKQIGAVETPSSLLTLTATILALSIAMFIGCVIDGLTEVLFRKHLKRLIKRNILLVLFSGKKQYEATELCRTRFNELLSKSKKYKGIDYNNEKEDEIFAAAFFFHSAKPEHVSWLVQHHSIHILATDYIILILVFTLILPILQYLGLGVKILPAYLWVPLALCIYPLCYLAVDRRLYTYEVAYRNATIYLCEEGTKTDVATQSNRHKGFTRRA